MEQTPHKQTNRRSLLRTILRYAIMCGTVLGGIVLIKRNGGHLTANACRDPQGKTGCGPCRQLASCGLPRGLSFKQVRREIDHDR